MRERPIHNGHGRVPGIRRLQILWMPGMEMGIVIQVNKKIRHIIMRMMYLKTSSPTENISQNYNTIGGRKSQEIRAFSSVLKLDKDIKFRIIT